MCQGTPESQIWLLKADAKCNNGGSADPMRANGTNEVLGSRVTAVQPIRPARIFGKVANSELPLPQDSDQGFYSHGPGYASPMSALLDGIFVAIG